MGVLVQLLIFEINPWRACATKVTGLGLCLSVCVSTTILALQATKRHQRPCIRPCTAGVLSERFWHCQYLTIDTGVSGGHELVAPVTEILEE